MIVFILIPCSFARSALGSSHLVAFFDFLTRHSLQNLKVNSVLHHQVGHFDAPPSRKLPKLRRRSQSHSPSYDNIILSENVNFASIRFSLLRSSHKPKTGATSLASGSAPTGLTRAENLSSEVQIFKARFTASQLSRCLEAPRRRCLEAPSVTTFSRTLEDIYSLGWASLWPCFQCFESCLFPFRQKWRKYPGCPLFLIFHLPRLNLGTSMSGKVRFQWPPIFFAAYASRSVSCS